MKSIPAISRLDYLDEVLAIACRQGDGGTLDQARIRIGQWVEDRALRGEARQARDWRNPLAYRDAAVSTVREMMRWGLIEPAPLADSEKGFERVRHLRLRPTAEGRRVEALAPGERRDLFGQKILAFYPLFRDLHELLAKHVLVVPELSDAQVKEALSSPLRPTEDQEGWDRLADTAAEALERRRPPAAGPVAPTPAREQLSSELGRHLRRRFRTHAPAAMKEVTGTVNKAVAQRVLHAAGFSGDWNAFDRCLRWGRDLYLCNDARHVFQFAGWVAWTASRITRKGGAFEIERRGVAQHRDAVQAALIQAYTDIATARRTDSVQVPLVPIYEVRETAAFRTRVCDEVVDRVLADMAMARQALLPLVVRLHLADLKDFAPSARPFRIDGKRFFYISMETPAAAGQEAVA